MMANFQRGHTSSSELLLETGSGLLLGLLLQLVPVLPRSRSPSEDDNWLISSSLAKARKIKMCLPN